MRAVLSFKKPDKKTDILTGITQKEKVGSHVLCLANDLNGLNNIANCYLKAPYDCVVKSIYSFDNTVLFESTSEVTTPSGTYDHCWFMCTHMLDADYKDLGIKVGKTFKQGQICYREGTKGIGAGPHIHFECGTGVYKNKNKGLPYMDSGKTYKYNGNTYRQMVPCIDGQECSINKMLYLDNLDTSNVNLLKLYTWTFDPKYEKTNPVAENKKVDQVKVTATALRVRTEPSTAANSLGAAKTGFYNVLSIEEKSDYTWYKIADHNWIAGIVGLVRYIPKTDDTELKELKAKKTKLETEIKELKAKLSTKESELEDVKERIEELS